MRPHSLILSALFSAQSLTAQAQNSLESDVLSLTEQERLISSSKKHKNSEKKLKRMR